MQWCFLTIKESQYLTAEGWDVVVGRDGNLSMLLTSVDIKLLVSTRSCT